MKKVGICTLYTGLNYGSALQAFSVQYFLRKRGFWPEIIGVNDSFIAGRNVSLTKLFGILMTIVVHPVSTKGALKGYFRSPSRRVSDISKKRFLAFYRQELNPSRYSKRILTKKAKSDEFFAFVCGSDQIWSGTALYVDRFYYLRFAPKAKRISFAPSFGSDFIPAYNRNKLAKYISQIRFLSVREESGQSLIKEMTGLDSTVIVDPTLLLGRQEWVEALGLETKAERSKRVAVYFLDEISPEAKKFIDSLIQCGYVPVDLSPGKDCAFGPKEFVDVILNSDFVVTDSFHGTAFSINFNVPFATFSRNYQSRNQSTRIVSLLNKTGLLSRLDPAEPDFQVDFHYAQSILTGEKQKAMDYLTSALESIEEEGKYE